MSEERWTPQEGWERRFRPWTVGKGEFKEPKRGFSIDTDLALNALGGLNENDLVPLVRYLVEAKSSVLHFGVRERLVALLTGSSETDTYQLGLVRHKTKSGKIRGYALQSKLRRQFVAAGLAYFQAGGLNNYSAGIVAAAQSALRSTHWAKMTINRETIDLIRLAAKKGENCFEYEISAKTMRVSKVHKEAVRREYVLGIVEFELISLSIVKFR